MRIALSLPSGSTVDFRGQIHNIYGPGEMEGRGPGIDVLLEPISQSVMWLVESALSAAGLAPAAAAQGAPTESTRQEFRDVPTIDDGDEWITAEGDLVQALWQELGTMSKMNPFQLLGVALDCSDTQVRAAFGVLSKKYHPDRFARYESFEIRELANEVFLLLRDGYRNIGTQAARDHASQKLQGPAPRTVARNTPRAAPINLALSPDKHGEAATRHHAPAVATPPRQKEATSPQEALDDHLAEGLALLSAGSHKQALRILQAEARKPLAGPAAKAAVEVAEGKISLEAGDRMEAAQRFEAALEIDPSNERAAQEIAEMRRLATSQRRGLLTKLLKKG